MKRDSWQPVSQATYIRGNLIRRGAAAFALFAIGFVCLVLLLAAFAFPAHAQTVKVSQFPGSTVGAKLTAAQNNGCSSDTNVPCVLVLDPEMGVFATGTLPTVCSQCVWIDHRAKGGMGYQAQLDGGAAGSAVSNVTVKVNGTDTASEAAHVQGASFKNVYGITSAAQALSTSTASGMFGVGGYASTNAAGTVAVGGQFQGRAQVGGTSVFGMNSVATDWDATGTAGGRFLQSIEADTQPGTTADKYTLVCGVCSDLFAPQSGSFGSSFAASVSHSLLGKWSMAFNSGDGAADTALRVGTHDYNTPSPSQTIDFIYIDAGSVERVKSMQVDDTGALLFAGAPIGGGGGTSVNVNGSSVSNPNFQATTPAAPAGNTNCTFQVSASSVSCYFPNAIATSLGTGTSVSLTAPRQYYVCTSTCTVTPPIPAAGDEFCVMNGDNVSTVITLAALGSSAMYENTARTAYGTAGTGTLVSSGAVGDKVCIVGLDSTHYLTTTYTGTWTAN